MTYLAMDLIGGIRSKKNMIDKGGLIGFNGDTTQLVIIRISDSWILKLVARLAILALVVVLCPSIGSMIGGFSSSIDREAISDSSVNLAPLDLDLLPLLIRDLSNERILKIGDRAVFLGNGDEAEAIYNSEILGGNEVDLVSYSDSEKQTSIPDETYDFAFTTGFDVSKAFIDRTLKIGGIAIVQLSEDPFNSFPKPANYRIVYLRRFDSTIVGLRKTSNADTKSPAKRRLFGFVSEAKKAALKNLEDVLLEPPRAASGKSKSYLKRTRYLPDITGDSLQSYRRRVFIDVGSGDSGWFAKHYPTKNTDFEIYKIETETVTATEESTGGSGMSDWLRRNVKEDEYVVMKAEAEVVEEMMKSKALDLVDELFMECKNQGLSGKTVRSRRAYWECLALYGNLRDEGVAVHQWWG